MPTSSTKILDFLRFGSRIRSGQIGVDKLPTTFYFYTLPAGIPLLTCGAWVRRTHAFEWGTRSYLRTGGFRRKTKNGW